MRAARRGSVKERFLGNEVADLLERVVLAHQEDLHVVEPRAPWARRPTGGWGGWSGSSRRGAASACASCCSGSAATAVVAGGAAGGGEDGERLGGPRSGVADGVHLPGLERVRAGGRAAGAADAPVVLEGPWSTEPAGADHAPPRGRAGLDARSTRSSGVTPTLGDGGWRRWRARGGAVASMANVGRRRSALGADGGALDHLELEVAAGQDRGGLAARGRHVARTAPACPRR